MGRDGICRDVEIQLPPRCEKCGPSDRLRDGSWSEECEYKKRVDCLTFCHLPPPITPGPTPCTPGSQASSAAAAGMASGGGASGGGRSGGGASAGGVAARQSAGGAFRLGQLAATRSGVGCGSGSCGGSATGLGSAAAAVGAPSKSYAGSGAPCKCDSGHGWRNVSRHGCGCTQRNNGDRTRPHMYLDGLATMGQGRSDARALASAAEFDSTCSLAEPCHCCLSGMVVSIENYRSLGDLLGSMVSEPIGSYSFHKFQRIRVELSQSVVRPEGEGRYFLEEQSCLGEWLEANPFTKPGGYDQWSFADWNNAFSANRSGRSEYSAYQYLQKWRCAERGGAYSTPFMWQFMDYPSFRWRDPFARPRDVPDQWDGYVYIQFLSPARIVLGKCRGPQYYDVCCALVRFRYILDGASIQLALSGPVCENEGDANRVCGQPVLSRNAQGLLSIQSPLVAGLRDSSPQTGVQGSSGHPIRS